MMHQRLFQVRRLAGGFRLLSLDRTLATFGAVVITPKFESFDIYVG
jgi:hypothetical protein